jgi:hypothetical protein
LKFCTASIFFLHEISNVIGSLCQELFPGRDNQLHEKDNFLPSNILVLSLPTLFFEHLTKLYLLLVIQFQIQQSTNILLAVENFPLA